LAGDNGNSKLAAEYEALRQREHELIMRLLDVLPKVDNLPEERVAQVRDALFHADNPFLIVFMGPFNSGKSSLINALLGEEVLTVGPVPTTDRIAILRVGEAAQRVRTGEYDTVFHPAPLLQKISFVDTPGLESVFQTHEETTRKFLHRADVVLLVMLATQAVTANTLQYLRTLQEYGKTVILVINQADLLSDEEAQQVRQYATEQIHAQLGYKPDVWLMSARLAQAARAEDGTVDAVQWAASGVGQLEAYVDKQFGDVARLRQKLQTPLQIVQNVNQAALDAVRSNQSALDQYQSIGDNVGQQLAAQKRDQDKTVRETVELVNGKFNESAKRGGSAIRDIFKLSSALGMLVRGILELIGVGKLTRRVGGDQVKLAFDQFKVFEPIAELPAVVDKLAPRLEGKDVQDIDDLVKYSRREIDALPGAIRAKIIGDVKPPLHYDRAALADVRAGLEAIEDEVKAIEVKKLEQTVQNTLFYVGFWGLFVIVLVIFLLNAAPLFSEDQASLRWGLMVAVLVLGVIGFLLLPLRGRWLAADHASRVDALQSRYVEALTKAADKQMDYGMQLRRDAVAPLMRLVEAQTSISTEQMRELQSAQQDIVKIEADLTAMGKPSLFGLRG
jgi:small GTP-binding protein